MATDAEVFEVRWEGTTDLDEEAMSAGDLDGLVFAVVAYRVQEAGATRLVKAHRRRKDVYRVEEFRVMTGELRQQAVQFLTGKAPQEFEQLALDIGDDSQLLASISQLNPGMGKEVVDDEAEQVVSVPSALSVDNEIDFNQSFDPPAQVSMGSVHDYKTAAKAEDVPVDGSESGPKVGKFGASESEDIPSPTSIEEREVIGTIHNSGYKRKDKVLHRFMEQD